MSESKREFQKTEVNHRKGEKSPFLKIRKT